MTEYTRAKIRINNTPEAINLVCTLNSDGTTSKYILEDKDGESRVDARSLLGVLYMSGEHNGDMYLVNLTADGVYPHGVDQFRA